MGNLLIKRGASVIISNAGNPILNGTYFVQDSLINNRKWYKKGNIAISWSADVSLWALYFIGTPLVLNYSTFSTENPWDSLWDDGQMIVKSISLTEKTASIKKQNITVSGGVTNPNPNGIYILQDTLINENKWYFKTFTQTTPPLRIIKNPTTGLWAIQYLLNAWITIYASTNSANNAWEAIWPNNLQVSSGSGGKLGLKSSAIPLNILNIRVNNGPTNEPWGVGGSGPCGNDFQLLNNQNVIWSQANLGCDFYVAWDNKDGSLPYKWRMYYDSDGRTDYAFHPTAGPEALPSKGWSNGMTITAI